MCLGQPSSTGAMLVPYGSREAGSSSSSMSRTGSNSSLTRQRTYSDGTDPHMMAAQSSPNMEGPISFVAPELQEETLMDVSFFYQGRKILSQSCGFFFTFSSAKYKEKMTINLFFNALA